MGEHAHPAAFPHDPGLLRRVVHRDAVAIPLIVDEPVEGDRSLGGEDVEQHLAGRQGGELLRCMALVRHQVQALVHQAVLLVAPSEGLLVQVPQVVELNARDEIVLHVPHQALHPAFCEGMVGLGQRRGEPQQLHEIQIRGVPDDVRATAGDTHRLHVVGHHPLGDATEISEAVQHADEQVLLASIGEELQIALPTMTTDHDETSQLVQPPVVVDGIDEAPVHLETVTCLQLVPPSPITLGHLLVPDHVRAEVAVLRHIGLDRRQPAFVSGLPQHREEHITVSDSRLQLLIQQLGVAVQFRRPLPTLVPMTMGKPLVPALAQRWPAYPGHLRQKTQVPDALPRVFQLLLGSCYYLL